MGAEGAAAAIGRDAPASCIAHVEQIPARMAEYAEPARPLPPPLSGWLAREGIRLYTHQVVVHKKYLSDAQLKALEQPPVELKPWDPIGSLAR